MKKEKATYLFSNKYKIENFTEGEAIVILDINYSMKNFSITPLTSGNSFKFMVDSHKSDMWKAVLKGIEQAIDFGNKEIGK